MTRPSRAPWIALAVLAIFGMFFLGVRYGREVEKANKLSAEVRRMLPTYFPTLQPTPRQQLRSFRTFDDPTQCGVSFTVDSQWKTTRLSSQSAALQDGDKTVLEYSCAPENPYKTGRSQATGSAKLGSESVRQYQSDMKDVIVVETQNVPRRYLRIHQAIYPLINDSWITGPSTSQ